MLCVQLRRLLLQPGGKLNQPLLAAGEGGGGEDLAQLLGEGTVPQFHIQGGEVGGLALLLMLYGPDEKPGVALAAVKVLPFSQNSRVGMRISFKAVMLL